MWALVPIKDIADAKQRLSPALAPAERAGLFRAMVEDVLAALAGVKALDGVLVVTRDADAAALAGRFGATVVREPANCGQTSAVETGVAHLAKAGAPGMIALPGDIPLVTAAEVGAVLAAHKPGRAMTIVPAHDRRGSNAIAVSPPDAMGFSFGNDSFEPHLATAARLGLATTVLPLPGIGLDVDTPDDLMDLLRRGGATRAHRYLAETGIGARVLGAEVG